LNYNILKNGELIAQFLNRADAWNYRNMMQNIARLAGCGDQYRVQQTINDTQYYGEYEQNLYV